MIENKEKKIEKKKSKKIEEEFKKEKKIEKLDVPVKVELVSFDVFFSMAMRKYKKIKVHHKGPMQLFFEKECGLLSTREQFEEILKKY